MTSILMFGIIILRLVLRAVDRHFLSFLIQESSRLKLEGLFVDFWIMMHLPQVEGYLRKHRPGS